SKPIPAITTKPPSATWSGRLGAPPEIVLASLGSSERNCCSISSSTRCSYSERGMVTPPLFLHRRPHGAGSGYVALARFGSWLAHERARRDRSTAKTGVNLVHDELGGTSFRTGV